jgi:carbamoyl-phosphate synthase large subunit
MEEMKILVTGVGGAVGLNAIKALRRDFTDAKILGVDANALSPGSHFTDKFYVVPRANESGYVSTMADICKRERVDIIFPCTDHELLPLALSRRVFSRLGVKLILSSAKTIEVCRDKWKTCMALNDVVPLPRSIVIANNNGINNVTDSLKFPVIIKPRSGWGSRLIFEARTSEELRILVSKVENPIIQEKIEGQEFTVDCLADLNGRLLVAIPRERIQKLAGVSSQGRTVFNEELIKIGRNITSRIRFRGPFNFQVILDESKKPYVIECNPRLAGASILSAAAGVNIASLSVKIFRGIKVGSLSFKEGVVMLRYLEEIFIEEGDKLGSKTRNI